MIAAPTSAWKFDKAKPAWKRAEVQAVTAYLENKLQRHDSALPSVDQLNQAEWRFGGFVAGNCPRITVRVFGRVMHIHFDSSSGMIQRVHMINKLREHESPNESEERKIEAMQSSETTKGQKSFLANRETEAAKVTTKPGETAVDPETRKGFRKDQLEPNLPELGKKLNEIRDKQITDHHRHEWVIYDSKGVPRFHRMDSSQCKLLLEKIAKFLNNDPDYNASKKPKVIAPVL